MCRLSSRGSTHVEPALSWSGLTQGGDQHGALILHLKQPLGIARQRIQAVSPLHNEGIRDHVRWGDVLETLVLEALGQGRWRDAQRIRAQGNASRAIVGRA